MGGVSSVKANVPGKEKGTVGDNSAKEAQMGGMHGSVRGKTKLACYKEFRRTVDRRRIENDTGLYMDAGLGTKQQLYAQMEKDIDAGEWVLYYHFGK